MPINILSEPWNTIWVGNIRKEELQRRLSSRGLGRHGATGTHGPRKNVAQRRALPDLVRSLSEPTLARQAAAALTVCGSDPWRGKSSTELSERHRGLARGPGSLSSDFGAPPWRQGRTGLPSVF
eukprot:TRINITY_DN74149_c0_g1_i1.p3 TRINITY_DN74149_c0_g1~~TRINITY_DN74149_c0_g1_i1.p3  ORF type:complete len:124 (-),score=14.59 TRINITY_DN74149_c0_g1_i1:15-386(-)